MVKFRRVHCKRSMTGILVSPVNMFGNDANQISITSVSKISSHISCDFLHRSFLLTYQLWFGYFVETSYIWIKIRTNSQIYRLSVAPQNLGVDPFPDPVSHFGAPWQPFWIFEVLIEGMDEYQPSGAGGTRSPPATPHRLQHLTASLIQNGRRGLERGLFDPPINFC